MSTLKTITVIFILLFFTSVWSQSSDKNNKKKSSDTLQVRENTSQEVITKIIRVKGANGEEKVIKQKEVITKKSEIQLNPDDQDKTNQSANYLTPKVSIEKSGAATNEKTYSKVSNETGFILTLHDENGEKVSYAMLLSNGYYLVHLGKENNSIGHFDDKNQLILERFNPKTKSLQHVVYKYLPIK